METRSGKRRRLGLQFRELPPEIFAIILSFYPDRSDPNDYVARMLRQLTGEYETKSSKTTEAVTFNEGDRISTIDNVHTDYYPFPYPMMLSKTVYTKNFVEHSFGDQPAIISHEWRLPLDIIGDGNLDAMGNWTPEYDSNDTSIETFKRELHRIRSGPDSRYAVVHIINLIWKNEGQFIREVESLHYENHTAHFTVKEGSNVLEFSISGSGTIHFNLFLSQCDLDGILFSIHSPKVSPMIKWARAAIETYRQ